MRPGDEVTLSRLLLELTDAQAHKLRFLLRHWERRKVDSFIFPDPADEMLTPDEREVFEQLGAVSCEPVRSEAAEADRLRSGLAMTNFGRSHVSTGRPPAASHVLICDLTDERPRCFACRCRLSEANRIRGARADLCRDCADFGAAAGLGLGQTREFVELARECAG